MEGSSSIVSACACLLDETGFMEEVVVSALANEMRDLKGMINASSTTTKKVAAVAVATWSLLFTARRQVVKHGKNLANPCSEIAPSTRE